MWKVYTNFFVVLFPLAWFCFPIIKLMSVCIKPRLIPFLQKSISSLCSRNVTRRLVPVLATPAPKSRKPKLNGYVLARFTPLDTWTHDVCALGKCYKNKTPDRPRMEKLMQAGLGKNEIGFSKQKGRSRWIPILLRWNIPETPRWRGNWSIESCWCGKGGHKISILFLREERAIH